MRVEIEEIEGAEAGRRVVLEGPGEFTAGRVSSTGRPAVPISPADTMASRSHFVIAVGTGACRVRDAGSANGTFLVAPLGERRIRREWELRSGDCVRAGATLLRFTFGAASPGRAPPSRRVPARCVACGADLVDPAAPGDEDVARSSDHLCDTCARARAGNGAAREIGGHLVLEPLGRGRMGAAWKAWDAETRRIVALKEACPAAPAAARAALLFLREVEVMKALRHPNVVRLLGHGRRGEDHWFSSELQKGGSVEGLLQAAGGRLPPARALSIARGALGGLEAVHEAGFVHRDVKPSNILLSAAGTGVARIGDFGLSKRFHGAGLSGVTRPGDVAGTPAYMAPEQAADFGGAGPRADVYAMGATLYRMLSGLLPCEGQAGRRASLADIGAAGPDLSRVVERALAAVPRSRWATARAFRDALDGCAESDQ